MVIVYDVETKRILSTEDGVSVPALPFGSEKKKREILRLDGRDYVSVDEEYGAHIVNYELVFDGDVFIGLRNKEGVI